MNREAMTLGLSQPRYQIFWRRRASSMHPPEMVSLAHQPRCRRTPVEKTPAYHRWRATESSAALKAACARVGRGQVVDARWNRAYPSSVPLPPRHQMCTPWVCWRVRGAVHRDHCHLWPWVPGASLVAAGQIWHRQEVLAAGPCRWPCFVDYHRWIATPPTPFAGATADPPIRFHHRQHQSEP